MKINRYSLHEQLYGKAVEPILWYLKGNPTASIGLVGGRAVEVLLPKLFERVGREGLIWRARIGQIDEFVPGPARPESMQAQLLRTSLDRAVAGRLVQRSHIHLIENQNEMQLRQAAQGYSTVLTQQMGAQFDIAVLSAGEDGHIGGIFPNRPKVSGSSDLFAVEEDAPKAPQLRLTATPLLLKRAKLVVLLFVGQEKHGALAKFLQPEIDPIELPARSVCDVPDLQIFTDCMRNG